jgi:hypothetical protein
MSQPFDFRRPFAVYGDDDDDDDDDDYAINNIIIKW